MLDLALSIESAATRSRAFNPVSVFTVAGLLYDPSDLSTMFQTGTRASPGAASVVDGPVGLILDKSGNNVDGTQAVAGQRPTLRSAAGLYWLEFANASSQALTFTLAGVSASTIGFAGYTPVAIDNGAAVTTGNQIIYASSSAIGGNWGTYNTGFISSGQSLATKKVAVLRTRAANDIDLITNGAVVTVTTGGVFNARSQYIAYDGGTYATINLYSAYAINRALTNAELTNMNTYQAGKVGVSF